MTGIYPLSGELKEKVERNAAQVRMDRIMTLTELEMQIKHLEGRLSIKNVQIQAMQSNNERLRDSICSRPLNPKRNWQLPEAPECPNCQKQCMPYAELTHQWTLGFTCCSCDADYKINDRVEWPFDGPQEVFASDMERLGFLVSGDAEMKCC